MSEKIRRFLVGRNFLWLIVAVFCIQCLWTAASIQYKIPPDEAYHFQFIAYYADRPITAGPIINDQNNNFILGDLQRTPNYIYHYALSFPLKVVKHLTSNINYQVFAIRLINIVFVLIALFILYKIMVFMRLSQLKINIVFLLLSLTGMFVWLSAAINYDNMALPLFWGAIYTLLLLTREVKAKYILLYMLLAMATVLTMTMYAPILLIAPLIAIGLNFSKVKTTNFNALFGKWRKEFTPHNRSLWLIVILFILFFGLFTERVGYNVVRYHALTPGCTSLHTKAECLQNGVFARAEGQDKVVAQLKQTHQMPEVLPIEFTGNWIDLMYERIYFYFGQRQIVPSVHAEDVAACTAALIIVLIALKRTRLLVSKRQTLILLITIGYTLILFFFNLDSYLSTASMFGYQGRYLLPIVPFMYIFITLLFFNVIPKLTGGLKTAIVSATIVLAILNVYYHAPPLVMLRGTNASWYTSETATINNDVGKALHAIKLVNQHSLKRVQ